MPNRVLLKVLHDVRTDLEEQQVKSGACIGKCQESTDRISEELRRLKEKEACAVHEDEEVKEKQSVLLAHLNSLTEKPQALLRAVESLGGEQWQKYQTRQVAEDATREKEQELQKAQTRFAVAEKAHKTLQKEHKEVMDQIRSVNTGS